MNVKQNSLIVKKLFTEVHTKGRLNYLDEAFSETVSVYDSTAPGVRFGLNKLKEKEAEYIAAFPSKMALIEDLLEVGQNIIARWTLSGKHEGWLHDFAPTHKNITISGISIYTFERGKIAEIHQSWDRLGLLEQIGLLASTVALA